MKSGDTGITKCCPHCKKTLLKELDMEGKGKITIKCPYCMKRFSVTISSRMKVRIDEL